MAKDNRRLPHIYLRGHGQTESYTSPRSGGGRLKLPERNREEHAERLERALTRALASADAHALNRDPNIPSGERGFYLEFEVPTSQAAVLDKLEKRAKKGVGIEVVSVRPTDPSQTKLAATVFVPEKYRETFGKKVAQYRGEQTRGGKPKNEPLIASIETVRIAGARSLFTEPDSEFPKSDLPVWWEVWLRKGAFARFKEGAERIGIDVKTDRVDFVERDVALVFATPSSLSRIVANSDAIAELRLARDTPANYIDLKHEGQSKFVDGLAERLVTPSKDAPAVCILDTGSTPSHPLLRPLLSTSDQHAYDGAWDVTDTIGHGTMMSGSAAYGDLAPLVVTNSQVQLTHVLESVKILPDQGANDPKLYGHITARSITKAEISAPERKRAVCLAVTSDPHSWRGRPTQWSAAIDNLAFGANTDQRLILISAGNIRGALKSGDYLYRNDASPIENPGQSWNALTVGAVTDRTTISSKDFSGWVPIAPPGDLCPSSRTSVSFSDDWPIKPDIVMEGGNFATPNASSEAALLDDLGLLTTHHLPNERLFSINGETSGATALASELSARIIAHRQELWPETVRGLMVHSAEWNAAMMKHLPTKSKRRQKDWRTLVRRYGWGVPSFDRTIASLSNDTTIVVEADLSPFIKDGSSIATNEMRFHHLPWPVAVLEKLGSDAPKTDVEMRVSLSYFIEPNPGERWSQRHQYASHGLRFDLRLPDESAERFRKRINKEASAGEKIKKGRPDKYWLLGPNLRDKGSVHSDIWRGPASLLANRDAIAVYPVGGWWKELPVSKWTNQIVRYSLIITLRVPSGVDIYTTIATEAARIQTPVLVEIPTG